jgi:16S rRNA (cytosine967-C5)-methyltransferase
MPRGSFAADRKRGFPRLNHLPTKVQKRHSVISAARIAAYDILQRLDRSRDFAVDLLQDPEVSRLKAVDRNLAVQLVMGVLRWRGDLNYQIERLSRKPLSAFDPEIIQILRLGIFQVRFLSRIPKPAAVHECVELAKRARKRSAAAVVNAVLRKCEPNPFKTAGADSRPDSEYLDGALRAVPEWIRSRWTRNFGPETATAIVLATQAIPTTCLRVMTPHDRERVQEELAGSGVATRAGVYSRLALRVESGDVFSTDAWRQRRIIIQEEASQLVGELIRPRTAERILDLCAAPGVKSGQLASCLQQGMLVACDRSIRRIKLIEKVLPGTRPSNVRLCRAVLDASQALPFGIRFDRVLADVPCSGTGTLARNPEAKWRLTADDLERLAESQVRILRSSLEVLAPGGRLVYSTCSLEPEENERVVTTVLRERPGYRLKAARELRQEFPVVAKLFDEQGYFRTLPGIHPLDGFFAAVITCD